MLFKKRTSASVVELYIYIPIEGDVARLHYYWIEIDNNNEVYYITNRRTIERIYINLHDFIMNDKRIIIEFYRIHYQPIVLGGMKPRASIWPSIESYSIFEITSNKKLCPECNKLTYTKDPNCVEYSLYYL